MYVRGVKREETDSIVHGQEVLLKELECGKFVLNVVRDKAITVAGNIRYRAILNILGVVFNEVILE